MPAPVIYQVSSSALNVTWQRPSTEQSQGEIIEYNVYLIMPSDDPFAPPQFPQASLISYNHCNQMCLCLFSVSVTIFSDMCALSIQQIEDVLYLSW